MASNLLKKWTETSLMLRILVGLVIGAVLGLLCPQWTGIGILGHVFVSVLKAIAPILVFLLVAASIAKAKGGLGPRFALPPEATPPWSPWKGDKSAEGLRRPAVGDLFSCRYLCFSPLV